MLRKTSCRNWRSVLLAIVQSLVVFTSARGGELLSPGDSAPAISSVDVVQGVLPADGCKLVVEFIGRNCAPCIEYIPVMEKAKSEFPEWQFVTVFRNSTAAEVEEFVERVSPGMSGVLVADQGKLVEEWCFAAGVVAIPRVFVVSDTGRLEWIGHPSDLSRVLAKTQGGDGLVKETPLELFSRVLTKAQISRSKERRIAQEINGTAIPALSAAGRYKDAYILAGDSFQRYRSFPTLAWAFRSQQLFFSGRIPEASEKSFELAQAILLDDLSAGGGAPYLNDTCKSFVGYANFAREDLYDERVLLLLAAAFERQAEVDSSAFYQCITFYNKAQLYSKLGMRKKAASEIESAQRCIASLRNSGDWQHQDATGVMVIEKELQELREQLEVDD